MKNLFINSSYNLISKYRFLNRQEQIKIRYGLEVMYYFFSKTFFIFLISYFFDFLYEVLMFNLFYIPLRSFAHGFHAKSNLQCCIITTIMYLFMFVFIKYCDLNYVSIILLFIISIISFVLWAPADTENLPLIRKRNRVKLKILSLVTLLIEFIILLFHFKIFIVLAIIFETLNINPITYKIFHTNFNNYAYFQSEIDRREG